MTHAVPAPAPQVPSPVVLVVDDAPDTLRMLCDALAGEGYTVLVARSGEEALRRFEMMVPDAVLLDGVMPGLSGFETCRRLKAEPAWSHVPVLFMTGLADTEQVVEGFSSGGVDYVVKPLRVPEVLARLSTHVRNAHVSRLAREAVDVGGLGVVLLDSQCRIAWRSPQAHAWLSRAFGDDEGAASPWLKRACTVERERVSLPNGDGLIARRFGSAGLGEAMLVLQLEPAGAGASRSDRLASAALTPRETEVLSWVAKGKTNRDIGDILGMRPRTVNKHLEHIFEKLGVETRAAAAALALQAQPG